MTATIRPLVGGTALAAGLWFLTAATAAPPALAKDSTKKATEADIALLQKQLDTVAADPRPNKMKSGLIRTTRALVLMLGGYADLSGDAALRAQVAKVGGAIDKSSDPKGDGDWKPAIEAAKGLSKPPAGGAAPKGDLVKFDLEDVMSPFRLAKSGGMNVEKDIREFRADFKANKAVPAKDLELIGVRSAVLSDHTTKLPNAKATANDQLTKKWEKYSKDMGAAGKELADEAGKGDKSDAKKLSAALNKLDATCSNCHNDFRNE